MAYRQDHNAGGGYHGYHEAPLQMGGAVCSITTFWLIQLLTSHRRIMKMKHKQISYMMQAHMMNIMVDRKNHIPMQ